MGSVFIISDTHFGDASVLRVPGRKEWASGLDIVEHDEKLIDNWNSVVTKRDKVYHLGDVGYDHPRGYLEHGVFPRLTGTIEVVGGNHDSPRVLEMLGKVNGAISKTVGGTGVLMTHVPVHPQELFWAFNIHGHLHSNVVRKGAIDAEGGFSGEPDLRYIGVSCEQLDFTPKRLDVLIEERLEEIRRGENTPA